MKIYLLILTILTNSIIYSQKTIELYPFDCELDQITFFSLNEAELIINDIKQNINSQDPYRQIFKTNFDTIRVKYKNIYNQNLDTIFHLNKSNQQFFLCINKFNDYSQSTLIEKAIKTNNKWELLMSRLHCEGILEEFSLMVKKKRTKYIVKYKFWKYIEKKNSKKGRKKKRFKYEKEINAKQINRIVEFEKKLRLINKDKGNCTTQTSYYIRKGKESISINEPNCLFYGEIELLKELGFSDALKFKNE